MVMTLVWLALTISLLLVEISTPGYFLGLSLTAGALIAALLSFYQSDFAYQLIVAAIVAIALFIFLKIRVKAVMTQHKYVSRVDQLIGQQAIVIAPVDDSFNGAVKVNGETWTARAENNQHYANGSIVTIIDVRGSHLLIQ